MTTSLLNSLVLENNDRGYLQVRDITQPSWQPIFIDFTNSALSRRRVAHRIYQEFLVRAVGVKSNQPISVIDATAGFGEDGFLLASAGCQVTWLERSPVMYALLKDALARARQQPELVEIVQRIQLLCVDARDWLVANDVMPEVIYLDPMFPERKKSALVKKEMRLLHQLVGADQDADQLLFLALRKAQKRVVVKRPSGASQLAGLIPKGCVEGKRCRYDLYTSEKLIHKEK